MIAVIGSRRGYREYLREHSLDPQEVLHVSSVQSLKGRRDVEIVYLPQWWKAYTTTTMNAIQDQVRMLEVLQ